VAVSVNMRHPSTGLTKKGFAGFSWTTLFFGAFPALFRGDYATFIGAFVIFLILAIATAGIGALIASIAWAFKYNKYYTSKLLERGYVFSDTPEKVALAKQCLGIA
jgi:hypothetical protein